MAAPKAITCFATWLDTSEEEQIQELEQFMRAKKIDLPDPLGKDLPEQVLTIVERCGPLFQEEGLSSPDAEGLFFSIASLLCLLPGNQTQMVVELLCDQIISEAGAGKDRNSALKLRILNLMYVHFDEGDPLKLTVLLKRLQYAAAHRLGGPLSVDPTKAAMWVKECRCSPVDTRRVYTALWEACRGISRSLSVKFLLESVKTFTEEDTASGLDQARYLVVEVLMDSQVFVFDHILRLPAVRALREEPSHKLLEVFVSGNLGDHQQLWLEYGETFKSAGLDPSSCLQKMKLLALVSLASSSSEVDFSQVERELQIESSAVEQTVVDAVRLKLISAKVDQINRKVLISGAIQRTFGRAQWELIHDKLGTWTKNVQTVHDRLQRTIKT